MSASSNTSSGNSQDHGSAHGGHGSFRSYMIGFGLSVVLTIIPFWLTMTDVLDSRLLAVAIVFILGAGQMIVHIYFFLHMNSRAEEGWLAMSLSFTVLLVVIVLSGSIWVMFHLDENMMPSHDQIERVKSLP
ncbi:cytochrome o ubiquinol oxidase subunit IV [Stappia sp. BW2]|jgi:cytochrome o ubiquinol oxidase operon protein cyoD|uniref:cytochrome o ubiquinol oxidase subunit IV n=1 Tax=Stappia sp. BW2 TaxID=2592622 RepID=UPI0011DEE1BB|nr:cytochrome o ubiquinol oxidase subunit IV [Stappia sp. BW2]TYC64118.1 cytochrome o ubiquinol oxidase subunit IV [Stappia sp. BW2]